MPKYQIARHRTAIRRYSYSRPINLALAHQIITNDVSVFDYGCGRGEDVKYLRADGIEAAGWDPHYKPDSQIVQADVVNLGYVINVIEDPSERANTLRTAFDLARLVLIVSVRLDHNLEDTVNFTDGFLTRTGSFQKIYTQAEFRDYLESVLGRRPHMATLGTAYIFRDGARESQYLTSTTLNRPRGHRQTSLEEFQASPIGARYLETMKLLGRVPLAGEFPDYEQLTSEFGSPNRIERIVLTILAPASLTESRRGRQADILTYLAMLKLQGVRPPPFGLLPSEIKADIKMIWSSYKEAIQDGDRFLYQLADASLVRKACSEADVGKKLPEAFYIHRSCEDLLPALLRVIIFAARQLVGDLECELTKISCDGRKVSFLKYSGFDEDPHPALKFSVKVFLPRATYEIRDYSESDNPPILHRKELLVDSLYPQYEKFAQLTREEEQVGLLSRSDIGYRKNWAAILEESGIVITGHKVLNVS